MTSAHRLDRWNRLLLAELLPELTEADTPVLLACDSETLRQVGARVDLDAEQTAAAFCREVKVAFAIGQIAGFKAVTRGNFDRDVRPRQLPLFFAVLCLWVLAASRMAPDERHPTHAYHHHLRELLELPGTGALPSFEFIRPCFQRFREWLDDDLGGRRGRLIVPDDPHPAWVGYAIAQTVFRARDRQILSVFFSERLRGGLDGLDPLPLLRRWAGRHQLTRHARSLVDDTSVAERVRAAVHTAYASWDGAELVEMSGGKLGRAFPARLHLLPHPPRLHLAANVTAPAMLTLDGNEYTLEPGGEIALPWQMLPTLSERHHVLGDPRSSPGAVRVPALGSTLLFETSEDGLIHIAEPVEETVWALTRDPDLVRRLESKRFRDHGVLPEGWALLRDVAVSALPGVKRSLAPTADRVPFTLEGGLPIERSVYLTGHPPVLAAGELELGDARLSVFVDDAQIGTIASGERLPLGMLAPGAHELVVGDGEYRARFHLDKRGPRDGYGTLVNRLDGDRVLRAGGARPNPGQGLRIRGAALSQPYAGALPVLTRSRGALASLDVGGQLAWHPHPPTPAWFAEAGLGAGRWEIVRKGIVWLLAPEPRTGKPWARLEQEALLPRLSPEAAALVLKMNAGDIAVSSRRHAAVAVDRWLELVENAEVGA